MYQCDLKKRIILYNLYVDYRFKLNIDQKAIVEMTRPNISPELHANSSIARQLHACGTKF